MSAEENKTMAGSEPDALTDEQLDEVAGGFDPVFGGCTPIRSSEGIIGYVADWWIYCDHSVYYWGCPKCGKPMHRGSMNLVYCDPCDEKKYAYTGNEQQYHHSAADLIAWSEGKTDGIWHFD
jgi:hypothetical protein